MRFRVEAISFTQVETNAAGGLRATTNTSEATASGSVAAFAGADMRSVGRGGGTAGPGGNAGGVPPAPPQALRQRSTSIDLAGGDDAPPAPPVMQLTASCNDHGLGLVCWNWE